MHRFVRVLSLLLLPTALHAQTTVRGTVIEHQTGTAIAGASVTITGTATQATTDRTGAFTLTAPSISSITVTGIGYASRTVVITPGQSVRVELDLAEVQLPGLDVVATQPEASRTRLTQKDLNRTSGLALSDAINTVPGVFMQSRTPFGGAHIDIRGYYPSVGGNSPNSNGLGYNAFINGIPITDAAGVTVFDDIDFASLGRVEVIKGPASSAYGSGIGGTVNMMTARPTLNQTSVGQQVLLGGKGLMRTNSTLQGANGNSDFVLNYGYQADSSWRPHSESRKYYARATGNYQLGGNEALSGYFSYNRSYEELAGEIDSTDYYGRQPVSNANYLANDSHIQLTSFFTGVADNRQFGGHFTNQTSVFGSGRFANQPFAHGFTDATQFNFGFRSAFGYHAQTRKAGIDGTLGLQTERSTVTSNGVFIVPAPPFTERPSASENYAANTFVFTEWRFALAHRMTVTAGGSLIKNAFNVHNMLKSNQLFDTTSSLRRSFDWAFAPRLEISKGLGDNALVYASVSKGFTPPLLSTIIASDGTINTGLKPEHAMQYEVGLQGKVRGRVNGQIAVFDLDNTDKLISQTVNSVTSVTNIGEQRNQGVEASASVLVVSDARRMLSLVRPWASFTYTDAKYIDFKSDNNNTANTVDFSGNQVARVPKNRYAIGLDLATKNGFTLGGTYLYVDKVPVTFDNSTFVRSYNLLNAKLGYTTTLQRRWMLNLAAGGDNLGGSTYYTFLFVGPNYKGLAQAPDGGTGDGYILPGNPSARWYGSVSLSYLLR
jgi:iron complex outermembrane receptor protein